MMRVRNTPLSEPTGGATVDTLRPSQFPLPLLPLPDIVSRAVGGALRVAETGDAYAPYLTKEVGRCVPWVPAP